jgi:hypothetical protein
MYRVGLVLSFLAATVFLRAAEPIVCKATKNNRSGEVAFVQSFIGTWNDVSYDKRTLIPHLSVCSDSELLRVKDGKQSAKDKLVVRDLFGNDITFVCADRINCENSIKLADLTTELKKKLKGKTPVESLEEFKKSHTGQTSTISRASLIIPRTSPSDDPWSPGAVTVGGTPISSTALNLAETTHHNYDLDLCLNADRQDCDTTLPRKSLYETGEVLPFGALPPGLHMLYYQVETLHGDTVPLRTKDRAFVLAVDPSLPADSLPTITTQLELAWMDPDATTAQLTEYVYYLASKFTKLAPIHQGPK